MENEMNIRDFAEAVVKELKSIRPQMDATVQDVTKNNGVIRVGICIKDESSSIAPTVYLDEMFQSSLSPEKAAENVLYVYDHNKGPEFDIESFTDWERAKEKICMKLVGATGNQEIPHIDVADNLQVVFFVPVYLDENRNQGSITIQKNHIEAWGQDISTLYERALENTPKLYPKCLRGMSDVLSSLMGMDASEFVPDCEKEMMYVLGNKDGLFGASCLLYPDVLKDAEEKIGVFIIIPSSIHETILVRLTDEAEPEAFRQMICDVNTTQVSPEEVLSDRPYFFTGDGIKPFTNLKEFITEKTERRPELLESDLFQRILAKVS